MEGDTRKALSIFDAALEKEPEHPELRFNRAVALLKLGNLQGAVSEFAEIANADSGALRAAAAYHAALAVDRAGRKADAEAWLEKALALDPSFDAARLHLGTLLETRGELEGAARAYLQYVKRHPGSTAAMLRLGVVAQRAGRVDVGRTYLMKVIERAPDSAEAVEARKFLVMWE